MKTNKEDSLTRKQALLKQIDEIIARKENGEGGEVSDPEKTPAPQRRSRAEINRANGQNSTGPKTEAGKEVSKNNALKHGFFAKVPCITLDDSDAYQELLTGLRIGMQPDGPHEEMLVEDLALLRIRLKRLAAVEFGLMLNGIETNPNDVREVANAYTSSGDPMERFSKIETTLRRAYIRTWEVLRRLQADRQKLTAEQARERSQLWLNYYHQKADIESAEAKAKAQTPPIEPPSPHSKDSIEPEASDQPVSADPTPVIDNQNSPTSPSEPNPTSKEDVPDDQNPPPS